LSFACERNHLAIVELLLDRGAAVDATNVSRAHSAGVPWAAWAVTLVSLVVSPPPWFTLAVSHPR
jgi:ankyrin repeat protein